MEAHRKLGKIFGAILIPLLIFQSACAFKQEVITTTPPPDMLLLMKAKESLDSGQLQTAEKFLNQFVLIFPSSNNYSYALFLKAEIAFKRGEYFSAYRLYLAIKKLNISKSLLKKINHRIRFLQEILGIKVYSSLF